MTAPPRRSPQGNWFRRLRIRWEIRDDIHEAFLSLACAIICWRRLQHLSLTRNWVLCGRTAVDPGRWCGGACAVCGWCPGRFPAVAGMVMSCPAGSVLRTGLGGSWGGI